MTEEGEILEVLSGVRDPELDEPITDLGFVDSIEISGDTVDIRLRLPTYFCAPNFAYIMVTDAREAVLSVPEVRQAQVSLAEHFSAEEINAGAAGDSQARTDKGMEELTELREWFRRKAFVARQEGLCRELLSSGRSPQQLAQVRLGEVPGSRAKDTYLNRRAERGLDLDVSAYLLVDPDGRRIPEDAVEKHLRFARATNLNTEGNAAMCRAVLASRYGPARGVGQKEEA